MFHWIAIVLGVLFIAWQLFYTFVIICSLIENTERIIFSIIIAICHSASPVAFVFLGYQCLCGNCTTWNIESIFRYNYEKIFCGVVIALIGVIYSIVLMVLAFEKKK